MKNIYDNEKFFESYSQMNRSQQGLDGAGEWQTLKRLLPDFKKKRVLDLGCGYGWHCLYVAIHYIEDFEKLAKNVADWLVSGGQFIFSVEHPIFTAEGSQDWIYDENGTIVHFPVDNYFYEGKRNAHFLGSNVTKYHRTLTTYLDDLMTNNFQIKRIVEPIPPGNMLDIPGMKDEMRRPMMLIVKAEKN